MAIVVEIAMVFFLYQSWAGQKQEVDAVQARINAVQTEINGFNATKQEATALNKQIDAAKKQIADLKADLLTLAPQRLDWSGLVLHLNQSMPPGLTVTSVAQKGADITVLGRAPDMATPAAFRDALLDSGLVSSVTPPSMNLVGEDQVTFSIVVRLALAAE